MRVNATEQDLLKRAAGISGALAASEWSSLQVLLRRVLEGVEVEPDQRPPAAPITPLVNTKASTA